MESKLLEKLARVLRDQFEGWELDKLFEISDGVLLSVLESIPAEDTEEDE